MGERGFETSQPSVPLVSVMGCKPPHPVVFPRLPSEIKVTSASCEKAVIESVACRYVCIYCLLCWYWLTFSFYPRVWIHPWSFTRAEVSEGRDGPVVLCCTGTSTDRGPQHGVGAHGGIGLQVIHEACMAPYCIPDAALGSRAFFPLPWLSWTLVIESESAAICLKFFKKS